MFMSVGFSSFIGRTFIIFLHQVKGFFPAPGKRFPEFPPEIRLQTDLGSSTACHAHCFLGLGSNFMISGRYL